MTNSKSTALATLAFLFCTGSGFLALAQKNSNKEKTMHTLRVARPTDNLPEVLKFYRDGLGLEVLASFSAHNGFDGVILGRKGSPYHLEFTHKLGHEVGKAPTQDNLLVFYIPDEAEWKSAGARMRKHGYEPVKSYNPWWDDGGKTFEDIDGYRVVLFNEQWDG
jgi:catechol 2,3-dioxygenase-like lactoylglutathione lyase family enzyme